MGRPRKHPKTETVAKAPAGHIAVERAYEYLRQQAISFGIRPGERINEVEISEMLKMSRAPVREALNRLVMNGLMAFEPRKGFSCRRLSIKEVSDLFAIRSDLELPAVKAACQNASDEDIEAVRNSWEEISAQQNEMDIETLVDCDEQFHLSLAGLAGNLERVKFMQNINERIRFVRRINLEARGRRGAIINDHSEVLTALATRDVDKAVQLLGHHLYFCPEDLKSHVHEGIARIYAEETA